MQDRAIRTRRKILEAAAAVFGERGYQAATIADILSTAGVTKGALYFHFASKEQLAQGVLRAQEGQDPVPTRTCKAQELVDMVMVYVHRLQTDSMVRAGVWLALNQQAADLDRSGPFLTWSETLTEMLEAAREQGELLPHVKPAETARVIVGAFAGVQAMSQTLSDYADLGERIAELLRHILPNVVISSVLASVTLDGDRGTKVSAEIAAEADGQHLETVGG